MFVKSKCRLWKQTLLGTKQKYLCLVILSFSEKLDHVQTNNFIGSAWCIDISQTGSV